MSTFDATDQALIAVHDFTHTNPGERYFTQRLADDLGVRLEEALDLFKRLSRTGLISPSSSMGGGYVLTINGKNRVEQLIAHRDDPVKRASALRNEIIRAAHRADLPLVLPQLRCERFGRRYTKNELQRQGEHLIGKGLLKELQQDGTGPFMVKLTADGEDCAENFNGDVAAYFSHRQMPAVQYGDQYHIRDNQGSAIVAGRGSNNTATVTTSGVDVAALTKFVTEFRPLLGLFGDHQGDASAVLTEMEAESASPTPDAGRLRTAFGKLKALGGHAGLAVVATLVEQGIVTVLGLS